MADSLAQEVRLNGQQKRMIIVLFVVIVILLLLWSRKPRNVTNNITNEKLGDLYTSPQYLTYNVPGLDVPPFSGSGNTGDYDWIGSSDLLCNCDDDWHPQTPVQIMSTQYAYIGAPALPPAPTFNFPTYIAPPLPGWWFEWGYNVHHELARFVYTSDGVNGILGKYSRSAWNDPERRSGYNQQTKSVTLQGNDAYIDGRHYKHIPSKDTNPPPNYGSGGDSFGVSR